MRVGITGHQDLPASARREIETRMRETLATHGEPGLIGVGSLAAGADQLFARVVAEVGGELEVVVPCSGYESTFTTARERAAYHAALATARSVERLSYPGPSEEAFLAAGVAVVDRCELLIAVWDGQPARGLGGTADIVDHARGVGRDVVVIWPAGTRRG
jgi:hypothetical protein